MSSMAWETPFLRSRMPASIEKFIKASCLSVCDSQIKQRDAKATSVGEDEITATFDIFEKLLEGKAQVILRRMKPFAADAAPGFVHDMNELNGGLHPPSFAYKPHLVDALTTFALKKA